jgi:hypothetical protein
MPTHVDLDMVRILVKLSKSQKVEFLHEKYAVLKVGERSKKPTYEGTKAF